MEWILYSGERLNIGIYLNPGNEQFEVSVNSELYVDKTELIKYTNSRIGKAVRRT